MFTFFSYRVSYYILLQLLTEINGYVNKTYVNEYRQEAKTVTCYYSKARCKHRISHVPNFIQVLNA